MAFEVVHSQIKKSREEIFAELINSHHHNNAVGIFLKDSGEMITTAVADIEQRPDGDHLIILREEDLHGYPLDRTHIQLNNVEKLIPFRIAYDDPQYVKVRKKARYNV